MRTLLCQIMSNDSLREALSRQYPYGQDLQRLSVDTVNYERPPGGYAEYDMAWLDSIARWLASIPTMVWILLGVVLVALLVVWLYRSGVFMPFSDKTEIPVADDVNIYDVDFDAELSSALSAADYAAALRIIYLRTLRQLVDEQKVVWRIYKTPSQYDREAHSVPFHRMTEQFLRVRYGKFGASEALYLQVVEWADQVRKGGAS